jgi:hypothetical protein
MRSEYTGIFQRNIPETPDEWFSGGGGLLGGVNSANAVAECAKRARERFRKEINLPEDTSKNGNVIVRLDSSRCPLTETQERDENRNVLEYLDGRDLRNNPVLYDVRSLVFAAEVFHLTWQKREALLRKQDEFEFRIVELLRELALLHENLQSQAMHIAALDIKIKVAPYEGLARSGKKQKQRERRMRSRLKKKRDAKKTLWMGTLHRLIRQHPKWTKHAIAKEARKNPPKTLKGAGLSTLERYLDKIVKSAR